MSPALFVTVLALVSLSLAATGPVLAHAQLTAAIPEPQATLKTAPAQVIVDFTEELEAKASSIRVEDANGSRVDAADAHGDQGDARRMIVGLKPLQPGTYEVIWTATAVDTHRTHGTYSFKVTG